jgi:O-methyltransferase
MTASNPRGQCIELIKRKVTGFDRLGAGTDFADYNALRFYNAQRAEWNLPRESVPLTLLTKAQLDLIEDLLIGIEARGVAGDCIEAGVWRGGAIITIRAILDALGMAEKQLIAADSFAGIPPSMRFRHDPVDLWTDRWVASLEEVKANVAEAGMQDGRIEFLQGLFGDTLSGLAGRRFAFIRLDSDSHDSVMDSLEWLYPLLNPGGIILVDDWHLFGCRLAIDNYRKHHRITDPIEVCAGNGFWIKS